MMDAARTYATPGAFRKALEDRLKRISQAEQIDISRLRRQVSFDRFLARLFTFEPAPWALKGGYALELRFRAARATIDIDLTIQGGAVASPAGTEANEGLRELLQQAAGVPLGDWFDYTIGAPVMDLDAAPYGGARFPVEARMDARVFSRFHLDAGIGDAVMEPLDTVRCRDWLQFAGVISPPVRTISREQQFAEKLHAYTLPRSTPNSRVKNLIDMALLAGSSELAPERVRSALRLTFQRRATHTLPELLSPPPSDWQGPFRTLAGECGLSPDVAEVFGAVRAFFERVVAGGV